MRSLKNLKITESIQTEKLVFEESSYDKFDTISIYFGFSALAGASLLLLKEVDFSFNNSFECAILISLFICSVYVLYCKYTEKHLKEIKFEIPKEEAKSRIIEYGKNIIIEFQRFPGI
ncbi:hypothetical protein [Chryseobacterium sp. SG20098]|uniref:hypothetical protein n=1 Tax=Chryseobacterium sp. SG20098 TaxID=3074145 RepID=UPI0028831848|nr:hypothetical protein [Chryseobacterium sp. SG20098]WNI38589.1 hypothetical protein RHP76_08850 [Chryseobacterium sp. SG20098]